jgi:predicted dienelactone hydrolase
MKSTHIFCEEANIMFAKRVLMIGVLVAFGLVMLPAAHAQEGGPERAGLRPDAPPYGVRGPHPVGAVVFSTGEVERALEGTIWYPALNPDGVEETVAYDFGLGDFFPPEINNPPGRAIPDAAADVEGGPYPLVIFSHGGGWVWQLSTYLFEHLASHGFVVMAFYHPGTSWPDQLPVQSEEEAAIYWEGFFDSFITRPGDITRAIDYAETITAGDDGLAGVIDTDRIAVMGHSYGGYTAMMAAGARLNFSAVEDWCKLDEFATESMQMLCAHYGEAITELEARLIELAGVNVQPGDLWPSLGDTRVDAVIPIMPGPCTPILDADGLASVTVPALLLRASADTMGPTPYNVDVYWQHIASEDKTLVSFEGADHLLASSGCSVAWREMCFFCCADPVWDVDRAHDLIDHFVTAFLLAEFYGDADAAAALAPDAVQFPGITYETTEF